MALDALLMHCLHVTRRPAPRGPAAVLAAAPAVLRFREQATFGVVMKHFAVDVPDASALEDTLAKVAYSWAGCILMQASAVPLPAGDSQVWEEVAPPPAPGATGILSSLQATS